MAFTIASYEETTRAFNLGCDARIAGCSLLDNPYGIQPSWATEEEWRFWRKGWKDVNNYWGKWASRVSYFYPIKALPPAGR